MLLLLLRLLSLALSKGQWQWEGGLAGWLADCLPCRQGKQAHAGVRCGTPNRARMEAR